jgi:hypothetical protein
VVVRVRAPRLSVFGRKGSPARCRVQSGIGVLSACKVKLLRRGHVLARGRAIGNGPRPQAVTVRLKLTKRGRKVLARHLGGVHTRVAATGTIGSGTRSARARTRAIRAVEHFVTPPGSWLPNESALSRRGRRYLRAQRSRLVAVKAIHCDGYSAKIREESPNATRISLARATTACAALRRHGIDTTAIGHGDEDQIAPNTTAAGRAQNRRVKVTITHRRAHL